MEDTRAASGAAVTVGAGRLKAGRYDDASALFWPAVHFGVRVIANGLAFDWARINLQRLRAA